jgi:TP901 family phage tail tape measure protein
MANINEEARIPVYLNDEQAVAAMKNLQNEADKWRKKMHEAMAGGDMKGMKTAERELKKVNKEASKFRKASFETNKVLNNLSAASYKDLRQTLRTLTREQENLNRKSKEWKTYQRNIRLVRAEMKKVNGSLQTHGSFLSKASNSFNKYFGIASAGIATLTGVVFSVKEWTKGLVDLDDALADVMKTTGLTRAEVRGMYTDFRYLNTRTPRKELLLLAEEAGRLGKKSKKDIEDFVEVANQIKVALGDDLGGEASVAIREVGKLTDIYRVGEQYGTGFKDSMTKVGSAINEVSANSNTQAPYLIDYLKRMGGIAGQMDINASKVIGYASALDQLGQSQEMAATAQGKVMVDMFKDQAKYAEIANMSTADFSRLLETDANEAFLKLLEGLNGNNEGFSVMAKKLDDLGIDGARAVQVLSVLSANTKMVREQQAMANKAMNEGTSLANEYNIKNNNLAGSMDKISRALRAKFINSGFLEWMEKAVSKAAEWTEIPVSKKLQEEQASLNLLVASITNAANSQETRNTFIKELQKEYPDFLGNLDAEKVTNEELSKKLKEVNEQYENKILLAVKEEKLAENYKERTDLKLEELRIIKEIAKYEEIAAKAREKVANETDPNKFRTLLTQEEINALNAMDILPNKLETIRGKFQGLLNDEAELNAAIKQLMTGNGSGGTGSGGGTGGNAGGGSGGNAGGGSGGSGSGGSGGNANGFAYEEATEDPMQVEGWMTDDNWDQYGAEELAARQASEEEWTQFLLGEVQKRIDAEAKALQFEQEAAETRKEINNILIESAGQVASSLAGMFEQGSGIQIAMIAIEKAAGIAKIWINYAKETAAIRLAAAEINAVTFGIGGNIWGAAQLAKAKASAIAGTALIGAQTVASAASAKKRQKTQAYAEGKYPETLQTGTYGDRPHYALFNEVPGYPEMVVDGRTFKTMQMNYPELINAIYRIRDGKQPGGYADGKYEDGGENLAQPYTDPALLNAIDRLVVATDKLEKNGIKAYVNKYGTNGLDEAIDDISKFKNKVYRP